MSSEKGRFVRMEPAQHVTYVLPCVLWVPVLIGDGETLSDESVQVL
jgi:hypothetical protein